MNSRTFFDMRRSVRRSTFNVQRSTPRGLGDEAFATHLLRRYSTLVVPGRFFESPGHVRLSFGCSTRRLTRGLANGSRALDDLI
jgi:aspartate/methionine/tyrosine aminotransferase